MSPSDLKHIEHPRWIDPAKGEPTLMLFSVVDDRSGVAYQEYHCVYGEDAETALRFLFNSMAPKADPSFPFQGRPKLIYLDNGPVAKRRVFQSVMRALGIEWQTHIPASKDGTRTTARSKGKVERPFRTVKEAHETLYHFHKPETEAQANEWLLRYLVRTYNQQTHRAEPLSRIEDWITHVPTEGSVKCAHGISSAALLGSPSGAKSGLMPESPPTVPRTSLSQRWPATTSCCSGAVRR